MLRAATGGYRSAWKSRYWRRGTVIETGKTASAPPPPSTTRRLISAIINSSVEGGVKAAETIGTGNGAAPVAQQQEGEYRRAGWSSVRAMKVSGPELTFGKPSRSAQFGPAQGHVSLPREVDDPSTRIQQRDQNAGPRVDPLSLDSPVLQVPEIVHRIFAIARAGKAGRKDLWRSGRKGSEMDMPRGFDPGVGSDLGDGSSLACSDIPTTELAIFTSGGDGATVVTPSCAPRWGWARKSISRVGRLGRDIKDRDGILGGSEEERRRERVERHRFDGLAATRERNTQNRRGRVRAGCGCSKVERVGSRQCKDVDLAILAADRDQVVEPVRLKARDGADPGLQSGRFGPLFALMIIRQDDERTCVRPRGIAHKRSGRTLLTPRGWVLCTAIPEAEPSASQ